MGLSRTRVGRHCVTCGPLGSPNSAGIAQALKRAPPSENAVQWCMGTLEELEKEMQDLFMAVQMTSYT